MKPIHFTKIIAGICLLLGSITSNAQHIGTDVFLKGQYMEVGVGILGSYGTVSAPPAGYHPHGATGIGFIADPAKDGWTVGTPAYMGDYFLPGSPFEGWTLQADGNRGQVDDGSMTSFASTTGMGVCSGSNISYSLTGSVVTGVWQGMLDSIQLTQTTSFDTNDLYFNIKIVLTNTALRPRYNLYYFRSLDPDNDESWSGGGFVTTNIIEHQAKDTTVVSAVGATGPISYMALGTTDTNSTAVIYNSWALPVSVDLSDVYNQLPLSGGSYYTQGATTVMQDNAIGLVTYIPHLATVDSAADSVARTTSEKHLANTATFSYFYAFSPAAVDSAIKHQHASPTATVTPPQLAVKNVSNGNEIKLYPNPTREVVNITGLIASDQITVYNMMGQPVIDKGKVSKDGTNAFPLNGLAAGNYIVTVSDHNENIKARLSLRKL